MQKGEYFFLSYRPDRSEKRGVSEFFLVVSAGSLRRTQSHKERVVGGHPAVSAGSVNDALKSSCGRKRGVSAGSLEFILHASPQTPFRPDRPSAPSCCGFQCCHIGRIASQMTSSGGCKSSRLGRIAHAMLEIHHAAESTASRPDRSGDFYVRQRARHLGRIDEHTSEKWGGSTLLYRPDRSDMQPCLLIMPCRPDRSAFVKHLITYVRAGDTTRYVTLNT